MVLFEWTLALLFGAVLIAALARRLEVPYPALLALAGAALAFLPFAPAIEIEPDLALALFVAPVLLDAAFDTSPRDLKRYALSLASLAFVVRHNDHPPASSVFGAFGSRMNGAMKFAWPTMPPPAPQTSVITYGAALHPDPDGTYP